ncbi:HET-domain-containing protein [Daldinia caldariorum]|uniref:HET-domain-containing protein n=1 Tax=Daldinia caldariorum TaxID=326644 RepID=UPI00200737B8|nr:HET-domain-containing protein [Daldinia caldariorum]KAI1473149.1 HET-domain-containing protein [Daldinia caldariorum]
MLCDVCREGLRGIWDPENSKRVGLLKDIPEILEHRFPDVEDDALDGFLAHLQLKDPEYYVFGHHADYDSLRRSKEDGCVACKELDQDEDDVNPTLAKLGYFSVFCVDFTRCDFDQLAMYVYIGGTMEQVFHELVVHDENDSVNSMLSTSTSDVKTWSLVQTWLERCLESHSLCRNQSLLGFSPTRLLEIVTIESEKIFRLVSGGEIDPAERYVSLSHCWGPGPTKDKLLLVSSTNQKLRGGLPVNSLPKTFRDAFEIAQRLNIRYIWIDRLCIVQDSEDDWRAESAIMQKVYRNGFLNIAALGSKDDAGGCFFDRNPERVGPTIINLSPKQDPPSYYRFKDETNTWASDFQQETLIKRGWVLQERMLAARNLYFGSKQVFWECCTTNCCETIPAGPLLANLTHRASGLDATDAKLGRFTWKCLINPASTSIRKDSSLLANLLTEWAQAVQEYSKCDLTYPSDKLVALSGLENDMRAKLRSLSSAYDVYYAGMWEIMMPASLLWKVEGASNRPSVHRAPSWSWASVDGPLNLPAGGTHSNSTCHLIELLGVERISKNDAICRLRGPVCFAKDLRPLKPPHLVCNVHCINTLCCPSTWLPIEGELSSKSLIRFDDSRDLYDEVVLLLFWSHPYPEMSMIMAAGLALVPVAGSYNLYRRVGYADIYIEVDLEDHGSYDSNPVLDKCPINTIEVI